MNQEEYTQALNGIESNYCGGGYDDGDDTSYYEDIIKVKESYIEFLESEVAKYKKTTEYNANICNDKDVYINQLKTTVLKLNGNNIIDTLPFDKVFARPHFIKCPLCGTDLDK